MRWVKTWLMIVLLCLLTGCTEEPEPYFQGYVEGDFVLVGSPLAGRLETLAVSQGQQVSAGDLLFSLEQTEEAAALREAQAASSAAASRLKDLTKGQRPPELAAVEARLAEARSSLRLARQEWQRRQRLYDQQVIAREELDQAQTSLVRSEEVVSRLEADLATARLAARPDRIQAARDEAAAARARLEQARWRLDQKNQAAGEDALVFETLFEPGEFVAAGRPVISLLPPERRKIRFFVPERVAGGLTPGQRVTVIIDGGGQWPAVIDYIFPQAEYTPPVIYSRETRAKLVYLVEALPLPADAEHFRPGQPVEVHLEPGSD